MNMFTRSRRAALPLIVVALVPALFGADSNSGLPGAITQRAEKSPLSSYFVPPARIVWKSAAGVENAESLLKQKHGQATLTQPSPPCVLKAEPGRPAAILLDFGVELAGYVELFTPIVKDKQPAPIRIRFGESASEAMSEPGVKGAQNDHAVRDFSDVTPWLGKRTYGPSGFRFVRIDATDPKLPVSLTEVRAVLQIRDIPRLGSFRCNDERLNRIWDVGAYTVHLNMQDYLWDGVKRDRLVWIGDMHPETSTIAAVFGANDVVTRSLDLTRDITPVSKWMNDISSYSMWWVLIHEQWWLHTGDRDYLAKQRPYLRDLMLRLTRRVGQDGHEKIDGMRFLDWPSSPNKQGVTAGLQALLLMTLESGARLLTELGDVETAKVCSEAAARAKNVAPDTNGSKSGAALQVLAGLADPKATAVMLKKDGARGVSTFYGFYVLQALGRAGETDAAMEIIRTYWGGMLDRGATTFWEDFDLAWLEGSGRIDELTPAGKNDLHGDYGAYCYEGFRHSFCHGWASGPTAWLSQHVLGIEPQAPGFKKVRINPRLGSLQWAEGSYPTPHGVIRVRHEKRPDGTVKSDVQLPAGVERVERP